jgi:MFS family permease
MGYLSDRFEPIAPMIGSTLYSCAVVLYTWYSSKSFASLLIFCLLYGLFAGGYSVLYCRFVTALTDKPAAGLWLYSIFEFQRGIGNLVGGPVSGILAKNVHTAAKYENLILFVGIAFLVSSLGGLSYWVFRCYRINSQGRCIDYLK